MLFYMWGQLWIVLPSHLEVGQHMLDIAYVHFYMWGQLWIVLPSPP